MRRLPFLFVAFLFFLPSILTAKELPKFAVWDIEAQNVPAPYVRTLTSIVVSEISKLDKYEVYSQDNVRTLAGWTAERMQLGCTDSKCLTALGQMDIAKLVSGSVGRIGNRFSVSLNLFDTQNARAEKSVSEFGRSEDELIDLVQVAVRKLLGAEVAFPAPSAPRPEEKLPEKPATAALPEYGKPFTDPVTRMEFVFVKGGCYEMGDTFGDGYDFEKPHEVCLDDFYLSKYEVTQGQWEKVMGNNPSHFKEGSNYPVENVSWNDIQQFIARLNGQTDRKYRLPTEAEWEYAARSGGKREKYSGTSQEKELDQYAWTANYNNPASRTHAVGQKYPNGLGLYDMTGNVSELCSDLWGQDYYKYSPRNNPRGPDQGIQRVVRGGSCRDMPWRVSFRVFWPPLVADRHTGFRLVLAAP
jgi:formylglycine-generating enzyme required for sulfatase activity